MNVVEYERPDGSRPFLDWITKLDRKAKAKVLTAKARMELGNTSNIKWFDGIGEFRIDWGPGYRIYLMQDGLELIILFGGGTKKTQPKDVELAKALRIEYKRRKRSGEFQDGTGERD